jgi:hypothetical protein
LKTAPYGGEAKKLAEEKVKVPEGPLISLSGQVENMERVKERLRVVIPIKDEIRFGCGMDMITWKHIRKVIFQPTRQPLDSQNHNMGSVGRDHPCFHHAIPLVSISTGYAPSRPFLQPHGGSIPSLPAVP